MDRFALSGRRAPALACMAAAVVLAGCGEDGDDENTAASVFPTPQASPTTTQSTDRNRAPVISGVPNLAVDVGNAYDFAPTATDYDGDALRFTVFNLPHWLSFDSETGQLEGTPSADDAGYYPNIIVRVSDGHASASLPPFALNVFSDGASLSTEGVIPPAYLTWVPPTEYEDGSPFYELAGYRVRYGLSSGQYTDLVEIPDPFTTILDLGFLADQTYYFVITAYSYAGAESDFSNEETIALN